MGPRIIKMILKRDKKEELTLPDFRTYYKALVIKAVWSWLKDHTQIKGIQFKVQK